MVTFIVITYVVPALLLTIVYLIMARALLKEGEPIVLGHVLTSLLSICIPFVNILALCFAVSSLIEHYEKEIVKFLSIRIL